jgi:DNA invertase Pin-like site-specific DNA recombinase
MTDTLIGDADGVYQPGLFNDRLVLGLKGTMSEAELHILRARLDEGIRNKATRGELRRGLPVGFVWGEEDGEVRFHPDEAVTSIICTVFERFAELGSARRVWLKGRYRHVPVPETDRTLRKRLRQVRIHRRRRFQYVDGGLRLRRSGLGLSFFALGDGLTEQRHGSL